MNTSWHPDREFEKRVSTRLLDVLIRAGLIGVLAALCYVVFAPFLTLMAWALILAVTLYPLHRALARKIGGRQGLAATVLVIAAVLLVIVPTTVLMDSLGSSVSGFIHSVQNDTLEIPALNEGIRDWPVVGDEIHDVWSKVRADLPGVLQSMQPKIAELGRKVLSAVASIGGEVLRFLASFVVAGIVMAYGEAGARASRAILERIMGEGRGAPVAELWTTTIRAVAQGVVGVAFIQALVVGLALMVAHVPWAGALAGVTLVLSIAQVPALVVTVPAVVYIWSSGDYGTGAAAAYTVILLAAGMADNVLKPLLLGRGVDAPMPVILLGALGGMATAGILGMFVGSALLALGYQLFMGWVASNPDSFAADPTTDPRGTP